jgi:hypothetical protein
MFPVSTVSRLRKRLRARGFSHISMTMEAAGVMGWFVVLVLSEKYMNDASTSRRAAETSAQQSSVSSAMSNCQGGSQPATAGSITAQTSTNMFSNGMPQLTPAQIPPILSVVGVSSLQTLPNYFKPFQGTQAQGTASPVTDKAPRNQTTSGQFTGVSNMACLEKPLDTPGAPWPSIETARIQVFVKNIAGY